MNGSPGLFKNYTKLYKNPALHDFWSNFLILPKTHLYASLYGILIKITIKYIKGA